METAALKAEYESKRVKMNLARIAPMTAPAALAAALAATTAAASVPDQSVTDESLAMLCERSTLSQSEINALRESELYVDLLEFTLEYCPEVAAILTDGATAVTTRPAAAGKDK